MADNGHMSSEAIVRQPEYRNSGLIPHGSEWEAMKEQAQMLVDSGFVPAHLDTANKVLTVLLCGRELGVPPMQAIRGIHVINGQPSLSAELMLALAHKNIPGFKFKVEASNEQIARVTGQRPGGDPVSVSFSLSDASRAGLTGKDAWKKYPGPLLRARATSACLRIVCPDAIRGIYTPDELGRAERDEDVDKLAAAKGVTLPQVGVNTTIDANYEVADERPGNTE